MPQIVPSAGFTPPCDYSAFADNFDLSLLPGGDLQFSPLNTSLYTNSPPTTKQPKLYSTYYNNNQDIEKNINLETDIQNLFALDTKKQDQQQNYNCGIYLDIPSQSPNNSIGSLSPYSTLYYPNSPESFYTQSPGSVYSKSPNDDYMNKCIKKETSYPNSPIQQNYSPYHVKEETYLPTVLQSPSPSNYSSCSSPQQIDNNNDVLELFCPNTKQIKQESTVDFGTLLQNFDTTTTNSNNLYNNYNKPSVKKEDHQLLREVLRDTSFQKKHNIKPIDIPLLASDIKMEEPDDNQGELINSCNDLTREKIEPVLNLAIEQMRKDVRNTCTTLGISPGKII